MDVYGEKWHQVYSSIIWIIMLNFGIQQKIANFVTIYFKEKKSRRKKNYVYTRGHFLKHP